MVCVTRPEVVNKRTAVPQPGDVYIGRPSPWGNPYIIGQHGSRDEVIEMFAMACSVELVAQLRALEPKRLVCWCAPEACHGDWLADAVAEEPVESTFP